MASEFRRSTLHFQGIRSNPSRGGHSPKLIRLTEPTEDEYFFTEDGAKAGVTNENTSEAEPLEVLHCSGPM